MTEQDYKTVLRIWAGSGAIERYKMPVISKKLKDTLAILMLGAICGFLWGFFLGVRF